MITIRYKSLKSGKFSAYLDIISDNKRWYEFLKIHVTNDYSEVKKIAKEDILLVQKIEEIKSKRHLEIINDANGIVPKKRENIDFLQYVKKYMIDNSDETAQRLLFHLKEYSNGHLRINDITYEWIVNFKGYLKKLKQNSRRGYLWKLKQLLNHAVKIRIIDQHNFHDIEIPGKEQSERTTLDIEEVRILAKTDLKANIQVKQAFLFSCFSGLRLSDIQKLKRSDIVNDVITLRPQKTSNKIAKIPLTEGAKNILSEVEINPDSDLIFWKLPNRQTTTRHVTNWGLRAGIKKHLHFHAARHSFATIGISSGIDIYTMKELLVHSKIEMTQIYAKIVDEKKQLEVAKFPTM